MELVIPFLVVDAILGWMTWHSWHAQSVLGTRMQRQGADRSAFWLSFGRLAALFALALIGTIAAWHAA
jgi:hypothetical protein